MTRRLSTLSGCGLIVVAVLLSLSTPPVQAQTYTVANLGTLGGSITEVFDINSTGQVVGRSAIPGNWPYHAFSWTKAGGMLDLGTLGGLISLALAVNNLGQVVGVSETADGAFHAFLWTEAGGMLDLGTLGGDSAANDINDLGQVVGSSRPSIGDIDRPFLWTQAGGMVDLGIFAARGSYPRRLNSSGQFIGNGEIEATDSGGYTRAFSWTQAGGIVSIPPFSSSDPFDSFASDINESGQVAGHIHLPSIGTHAFSWTLAAGISDLGTLGGWHSYSAGINSSGDIVGHSSLTTNEGASHHAYRWSQGAGMVDLGTLGGLHSGATAINQSGQIVGWSSTNGPYAHAVLWTPSGAMVDLNGRIPSVPGLVLWTARSISDSGLIVVETSMSPCCAILVPDPVTPTPTGLNVPVQASAVLPDGSFTSVVLEFDSVLTSGTSTVTTSSTPEPGTGGAPPSFKTTDPPIYYNVETTAVFSGTITLCFSWVEGQVHDETNARLFHSEGGAWIDVTLGIADTVNNKVCGVVGSLSPFAIFEPGFGFTGFRPPVANPPTLNETKAGSAVPVKFSLTGYKGVNIFPLGFPASQPIACDSLAPVTTVESTSSAGQSGLSYDIGTDTYTYIWKTDKSWAGCQQLVLQFTDGGKHRANFKFK